MIEEAMQGRVPPSIHRRNILYVALDGAVVGLIFAGSSFLSVFVIRLGASALWVSLLSSIPSVIGLVMTIPWSRFADRQARPQRAFAWARLAVHAVYPLVAAVPFLLKNELAAKVIILIWSLSAFPGSLSNIMFTLVMGRAVAPDRRAFMMSRRWIAMGITKLIALSLIGLVIERVPFPLGYQIVYGVNLVLSFGAFYAATRIQVQARPPAGARKKDPPLVRIKESIAEFVSERPFLVFVCGRAVLNLGLSLVSALIPIYWVSHLNASDIWIGSFNSAATAATLVSYLLWARIKRKLGTRRTLLPSVLGTALYPVLLTLARSPAAVVPIIAFDGLVGGGLNLAFFDALLEVCPPDKEARFIAINMTAVNLMGVIGPPVGAALLGVLDIRWVLALGTITALAGFAIFAFARTTARARAR